MHLAMHNAMHLAMHIAMHNAMQCIMHSLGLEACIAGATNGLKNKRQSRTAKIPKSKFMGGGDSNHDIIGLTIEVWITYISYLVL